jgi:hypothetical protein
MCIAVKVPAGRLVRSGEVLGSPDERDRFRSTTLIRIGMARFDPRAETYRPSFQKMKCHALLMNSTVLRFRPLLSDGMRYAPSLGR